jgi:3-isopropylmalate dehydrogenase
MYRVAAIGGDGIGPEIIREGQKVLDAAGERYGFDLAWDEFEIGAERYLRTGDLVTEEELKELSRYRAIYFGAIGTSGSLPGSSRRGSSSVSGFTSTSSST